MSLDKHISTPTAILIGSAIVAVGLYLGLQGSGGPPSAPPPAPTVHAAPPPKEPIAPPRPAVRASRDEVTRQAANALEGQRARIVERCWKPSVAKQAQPASVKYVFNYTFSAEGHQIGRGVSEDRATARPDVTACMVGMLEPLSIPPPGANASVDIPLELR